MIIVIVVYCGTCMCTFPVVVWSEPCSLSLGPIRIRICRCRYLCRCRRKLMVLIWIVFLIRIILPDKTFGIQNPLGLSIETINPLVGIDGNEDSRVCPGVYFVLVFVSMCEIVEYACLVEVREVSQVVHGDEVTVTVHALWQCFFVIIVRISVGISVGISVSGIGSLF